MTAWDLVRRGTWHFHQVTRENHLQARELFREACKLIPISQRRTSGSPGSVPEWFPMAGQRSPLLSCKRGCRPRSRLSISMSAILTRIMLLRSSASSRDNSNRRSERRARPSKSVQALRLGHLGLGMALLFSGRASEAIAPLERGLRLSPYDPQNFVWFNMLALARLFTGRAEDGLEAAIRALQVRPNWWTTLEISPAVMPNLIDGTKREATRKKWQM